MRSPNVTHMHTYDGNYKTFLTCCKWFSQNNRNRKMWQCDNQ